MRLLFLCIVTIAPLFAQSTEIVEADRDEKAAEECTCQTSDSPETIVEAKSVAGNVFTMRFLAKPIPTRKRIVAHLCSEKPTKFTQAKLWMRMPNGHEHGSTPTEIKEVTESCVIVSKIFASMSGEWQVLIATEDKDSAKMIFEAEVVK